MIKKNNFSFNDIISLITRYTADIIEKAAMRPKRMCEIKIDVSRASA